MAIQNKLAAIGCSIAPLVLASNAMAQDADKPGTQIRIEQRSGCHFVSDDCNGHSTRIQAKNSAGYVVAITRGQERIHTIHPIQYDLLAIPSNIPLGIHPLVDAMVGQTLGVGANADVQLSLETTMLQLGRHYTVGTASTVYAGGYIVKGTASGALAATAALTGVPDAIASQEEYREGYQSIPWPALNTSKAVNGAFGGVEVMGAVHIANMPRNVAVHGLLGAQAGLDKRVVTTGLVASWASSAAAAQNPSLATRLTGIPHNNPASGFSVSAGIVMEHVLANQLDKEIYDARRMLAQEAAEGMKKAETIVDQGISQGGSMLTTILPQLPIQLPPDIADRINQATSMASSVLTPEPAPTADEILKSWGVERPKRNRMIFAAAATIPVGKAGAFSVTYRKPIGQASGSQSVGVTYLYDF